MLRVCVVPLILSMTACISSPEFTLAGETRDAPVSPDGRAETIALVEELGLDAGDAGHVSGDAAVPPHPERDAGTGDDRSDGEGDEDDGPGKGKGKPPKKKD
jgi:hypothetical protein